MTTITQGRAIPPPAGPQRGLAHGLYWVRGEIDQSLGRCRQLIEQYVEAVDERLPLQQAAVEVNLVRGTATMIECFGVAWLAEEMRQTLLELVQRAEPGEVEGSCSALLGAVVQIGDYIDALALGQPDCVLLLQPVINELRVARGHPVLTESDLFIAQISARADDPPSGGEAQAAAQQEAQRLLPVYQASLLRWFRNEEVRTCLGRIGRVSERLSGLCGRREVAGLWQVVTAVVEGLLSSGLTESIELRRLFGRTMTPLKRLAEQGELACAETIGDLRLALLFQVGRSRKRGARIRQLCEAHDLNGLLPSAEDLDRQRQRLRGPNTVLLNRVADEVRADLAQIKDATDLVVRAGDKAAPASLVTARERLQRISDTLSILGLSVLQGVVATQSRRLAELDPASLVHSRDWLDFATAILRVEHSLNDALFRQLREGRALASEPAPIDEYNEQIPHSRDLRESVAALQRESLVNLARLKAHLDAFLKTGDHSVLPDCSRLLDEVHAGLLMLELPRAAAAVQRLRLQLRSPQFVRVRDAASTAERMADAVASLEYYLEAWRDNLPQYERILADLERFVARLETALEPEQQPVAAEPVSPVAASEEAAIDPEIREVFLEEAAEVIATLEGHLPRFTRDPRQREELTEIRRAFHTLKGSGRMVGARDLGEFAWSVESLLNRCLEGALEVSPAVVDLVAEAVALLPGLIEEFRHGRPVEQNTALLRQRAARLIEARGAGEPDMAAVFREDARERLALIERWLDDHLVGGAALEVAPEAIRAFHTLRGAAAVVGADAISELSAAFETTLDAIQGARLAVPAEGPGLIREALQQLRTAVAEVGQAGAAGFEVQPWLARVEALQSALPRQAVQAANDRQLAEVFAGEALDLVQRLEQGFGDWSRHPDRDGLPQELKQVLHTLAGAALMTACQPVARLAQALYERMDEFIAPPPPQAGFYVGMAELIEGFYQLLDAFRDGRLRDDDGAPWIERAERLGKEGPVQAPPPALTPPAVAEPSVGPPADDRAPAFDEGELLGIFLEEADELLGASREPLERLRRDPASPAGLAAQAELRRIAHTLKGSGRMAGQSALGERAAALELSLSAAERGQRIDEPTIDQVLAGFEQIEQMVNRLAGRTAEDSPMVASTGLPPLPPEALPEAVVMAAETPEALPAGETLEVGEIGEPIEMPAVAEDSEAGPPPDAGAEVEPVDSGALEMPPSTFEESKPSFEKMARLEFTIPPLEMPPSGFAEAKSSFEKLSRLEFTIPPLEMPPREYIEPPAQIEKLSRLEFTIAPLPSADPQPVGAAGDAAAGHFDAELAEIFGSEARELLDVLENALAAWKTDLRNIDALREIQRALHTLKGGARMAGLAAMGSVAHEMEERVNQLEQGRGAAASAQFPLLERDLETLQNMHDLLARGDAQALLYEAEPEPEFVDPFLAETAETAEAAEAPDTAEAAAPLLNRPVPADPAPAAGPPDAPALAPLPVSEALPPIATGADPFAELRWQADEAESAASQARRETARVAVEQLDSLLNDAGEISVVRSRLEAHSSTLQLQLAEMAQAIQRLRDQLRQLDIETEAQIAARGFTRAEGADRYGSEFDPLEMDRYSRMQELSRALSESVGDLSSLHATMDQAMGEAETLLQQQARINTQVQNRLMGTLMVPFARQVQRLQRVVRQTAQENGKQAEAVFSGIEAELDRNVLERMTAPLEHLLRNSVVHGIEEPEVRTALGKPAMGRVAVSLKREGTRLLIELRDDGRGLDFAAIREQAIKRGLMPADAEVADADVAQFIFAPGFSTARKLTQDAGRGIGMDVVASEVKQLGGSLEIGSETGRGARFLVALPLNLAISQALLVEAGGAEYAIPLPAIEGIARLPREQLPLYDGPQAPLLSYGGLEYRVRHLADFVGGARAVAGEQRSLPVVLVRLGEGLAGHERRIALIVDQLNGNREIVSKAVGPVIGAVGGVSGATILADGHVVLILDIAALVQDEVRRSLLEQAAHRSHAEAGGREERPLVLVVDDSITMRRVAERLLTKNGYRVSTAKDGLDAMARLQTEIPAAILLDIEMPRADGFEVAAFVRNSERIAEVPIIMITSRSGDKHRERARSLGVNRYLIKPYQEDQLMSEVREVLASGAAA